MIGVSAFHGLGAAVAADSASECSLFMLADGKLYVSAESSAGVSEFTYENDKWISQTVSRE